MAKGSGTAAGRASSSSGRGVVNQAVSRLRAGIPDGRLNYLREGMRQMADMKSDSHPITITAERDRKGRLSFVLTDGRHRLRKAQGRDQETIKAKVLVMTEGRSGWRKAGVRTVRIQVPK